VRTDGLLPTIEAVGSKLDQPLPLGYCNVGWVAEVGREVRGFALGDRVVSNGPHAELVAVPRNLCARVPLGVSDDEAAFAVLVLSHSRDASCGADARRAFRGDGSRAHRPSHGPIVAREWLPCARIDPDPAKADLARRFGADVVALDRGEDPLAAAETFSGGQGVDGVLITAATHSNEPVAQARACASARRIVLSGRRVSS